MVDPKINKSKDFKELDGMGGMGNIVFYRAPLIAVVQAQAWII